MNDVYLMITGVLPANLRMVHTFCVYLLDEVYNMPMNGENRGNGLMRVD